MENTAKRVNTILFVSPLILFFLFLIPTPLVLMNSFKGQLSISSAPFALPGATTFSSINNYVNGVQRIDFFRALGHSLFITVSSVAAITLFTPITAWYIIRVKSPVTSALHYLPVFSMVVPFQMVMHTIIKIANILRLDNPFGVIVIYLGFGARLSVFIFSGFTKSVPVDIEESSVIDGCSPLQTLLLTASPILCSTAVAVVILNAMQTWNDFLLSYLVVGTRFQTILIAVQYLQGGYGSRDMGALMAMLALSIIPIIIFYLTCQKHIIKGVLAGVVKGQSRIQIFTLGAFLLTIKDITRESGFVVSTVSRALNNHSDVSEEAKRKIQVVTEAYHFVPNQNTCQLKQTATNSTAILVKGISNMLFALILERMQVLIGKEGYTAQVCYLGEEDDEAIQAQQLIRESKPLGLLFLGGNLQNSVEGSEQISLPSVLVSTAADCPGLSYLSSASIDGTAAAPCVVGYLIQMGYQNIGAIGGSRFDTNSTSYLRYLGCQRILEWYDIPSPEEWRYQKTRLSYEGGYHAMERLLQSPPNITAVSAMSDVMTIGVCWYLLDRNVRIPQDISVMGLDRIKLAQYHNPKLATIEQSKSKMAERWVSTLIDCTENQSATVHELADLCLREGESVRRMGGAFMVYGTTEGE